MGSNKDKGQKREKAEEPRQTAVEKYEIMQIRRDQIKNAPYNPRVITAKAKELLKDNLKKVGLMGPISWNRRTGNILSGHQRLDSMDRIEGGSNYLLRVAAVDLDEKTEKEQNVFMNNPMAQGSFDVEKMGELFKLEDFDAYAAGFDMSDVYNVLGEHIPQKKFEDMAALSNELQKAVQNFEKAKGKNNARNETEFYLVVVFKDNESRAEFCRRHGFQDFRYIDGREIDAALRQAQDGALSK